MPEQQLRVPKGTYGKETGLETEGRVKTTKEKTQHATSYAHKALNMRAAHANNARATAQSPQRDIRQETGLETGWKKENKEGKDPACDRKQQSYAHKALNTRIIHEAMPEQQLRAPKGTYGKETDVERHDSGEKKSES
ncbi:hypothetical protein DFH29DRAFT_883834 [Suillus ampliporus]|nr:hypothetical protein DFH29DRAFT_883834 [Suillus ampliporus]